MSLEIIFSRHGNTFAPEDRVVWVGAETDLPLVESGQLQARVAAAALVRTNAIPQVIYCATLRRTRGFADIVVAELGGGIDIMEDRRLNEVRYGPWAGLTSEEIEERLGNGRQLAAWSKADVWPHDVGWETSEADLVAGVHGFMEELTRRHENGRVMVVSSNGTLRYFGRLGAVGGEGSFVMKTGHVGLMSRQDGRWRLGRWNVNPATL